VRAWHRIALLVAAAGVGAALACGQAFTATEDGGGSDASTQEASSAPDATDARNDGAPIDAGSEQPQCPGPDGGNEDCIYAHCGCMRPKGALSLFMKTWDCMCNGNMNSCLGPSACDQLCQLGYPFDGGAKCTDCLLTAATGNACFYKSTCDADTACQDFGDCVTRDCH
jgi:hypothetical protein